MTWLPSERSEMRDPVTGHRVVRWTSSPAKDQHLYFTGPSVTADNRWLVFISERGGQPNLYAVERDSGRIRPLTTNARGLRLSYCYPWGGPTGLSKSTPCLDGVRSRVYAVIDDQVWRFDLADGRAERLGSLPEPGVTAFTHVSTDGRWLCVPLAPSGPFLEPATTQREQMNRVWHWVEQKRLKTKLWCYNTETGAVGLWAELPFWVTHVQFDPLGGWAGLCSSEGPWQAQHLIPRIWWLAANGSARPLFDQAAGEQCGHENFDANGQIVYHGQRGPDHYLARRSQDGRLTEQIAVQDLELHHAIPDGNSYLGDDHDGLIYRVSQPNGIRLVQPLCRHDSGDWEDQDNHVHPVATGQSSILFTSRRAGQPDVYEMLLPKTQS